MLQCEGECPVVPDCLPVFATPFFFTQIIVLHLFLVGASSSKSEAEVHWQASQYYQGLLCMTFNMPSPSITIMFNTLKDQIPFLEENVLNYGLLEQ